jgi:hypothetical protein
MHKDLLIISCSGRKRRDRGPAIDLYDGNLFRMLRKYQPNIDLRILSAKYGLIPPEEIIETYDISLKQVDAAKLGEEIAENLAASFWDHPTIYVEMGKPYFDVLESAMLKHQQDNRLPNRWGLKVRTFVYDGPGIGKRDKAFSRWCRQYRDSHPGRPDWAALVAGSHPVENNTKKKGFENMVTVGSQAIYIGHRHPGLINQKVQVVAIHKEYFIDPDQTRIIRDPAKVGEIDEEADMVEVQAVAENGRLILGASDTFLAELQPLQASANCSQ